MFPQYEEKCPEGAYEFEFEVSENEVDEHGNMKLIDAARRMEFATEHHLSMFDVDKPHLDATNKSWVVSWNEVYFKRFPKAGEKLLLRTWFSKNKTMMYSKKYAFFDENKEAIVSATTLFILMDKNTRKMTTMPEGVKPFTIIEVPDEPGYPKMIAKQPFELKKETKRVVTPDEIDSNGHLNNAYYIGWTEDLLKESGNEGHMPKKLWIQYTKELREGQEVSLKYDVQDGVLFVRGSSEEAESFVAYIEF